MKKLFLLTAVLFLAAVPASAQDDYPSAEIFGGYSYLSVDLNIDDPDDFFDFDDREGVHGFGFSVAGNLSRSVGIVGDFSYNKKSVDFPGGDIDSSVFIFLFGPRFTARGDTANVFGHVLVGGSRFKVEDFDSDVGFSLGVGGGVDINVSDSVGIRLVQADYIPTRIFEEWFHNLRFQIGIVFRAGQ
jgi:opacity protein-like surface antigen